MFSSSYSFFLLVCVDVITYIVLLPPLFTYSANEWLIARFGEGSWPSSSNIHICLFGKFLSRHIPHCRRLQGYMYLHTLLGSWITFVKVISVHWQSLSAHALGVVDNLEFNKWNIIFYYLICLIYLFHYRKWTKCLREMNKSLK